MGFHIVEPEAPKKRRSGNTRPVRVMLSLDGPGRLRVGHLLTLLSISAPTFYGRLKAGKVPAADGNDGRPYWLTSTVKAFLEQRDTGQ